MIDDRMFPTIESTVDGQGISTIKSYLSNARLYHTLPNKRSTTSAAPCPKLVCAAPPRCSLPKAFDGLFSTTQLVQASTREIVVL